LEDFSKGLKEKLGKHMYNIRHQYSKLRELKEILQKEEIIVHIDFAENSGATFAGDVSPTF
jgi:hypothetical protein